MNLSISSSSFSPLVEELAAVSPRRARFFARAASVFFAFTLAASTASAQILTAQQVTGFNEDLIANGAGTTAADSTSRAFDGGGNTNVFYSADFVSSLTGEAPSGSGLAADGLLVGQNGNQNVYQLADYGSMNALALRPDATSGTLTFVNPGAFTQIGLLGTSANGFTTIDYTINFQDGGSSVSGSVTFADWFAAEPTSISNFGRVRRNNDVFHIPNGKPGLYEHTIELAVAEGRTVTSIDFEYASGEKVNSGAAIFAVSAIPEPRTYALAVGVLVLGITLIRKRRV